MHSGSADSVIKLEKFFQTRVGDGGGGGDGGGDDGRIFPEHPSPILHAPRDSISRKGKSLTPIRDFRGDFYARRFVYAGPIRVLGHLAWDMIWACGPMGPGPGPGEARGGGHTGGA